MLARLVWRKFLLQLLVFPNCSKRKNGPKENLVLVPGRGQAEVTYVSAGGILERDGRCTTEELNTANVSAMYNLQFKFARVLRLHTIWLINCNHLHWLIRHLGAGYLNFICIRAGTRAKPITANVSSSIDWTNISFKAMANVSITGRLAKMLLLQKHYFDSVNNQFVMK